MGCSSNFIAPGAGRMTRKPREKAWINDRF
jgi:hypothetical protein